MKLDICGFHQRPIVKPKTQQCDLCVATELLEERGYVVTPSKTTPEPPELPSQEQQDTWWKQERRQVWLQAWCATAGAANCTSAQTATAFADVCLEAFDEKFPGKK